MKLVGIICEYNPLHLGHKKQFDTLRQLYPDCGIVCIMSGNYVQRGKPAVIDKTPRAKAAVLCGADLVLELPVTAALSSAEGFAAEGVRLLGSFCDSLCFGTETGNSTTLMETAHALLSAEFSAALSAELDKGLSFPAARQNALAAMGVQPALLSQPNDILAVEYCKAIVSQNLNIMPLPIQRQGSYHALQPDPSNPSATAVREQMRQGGAWLTYIPEAAHDCFRHAPLHTLEAGERAILARLRTMTDGEFEALPYGSEGLWRKLMHSARQEATLESILTATKSKRYTRTRLDRMVMCAFLGLTHRDLSTPAPYARVLALNDRGREILKQARRSGSYPNAGESVDHPYQAIEARAGALYSLFCTDAPAPPDIEAQRRVCYLPSLSE